MLDASLLPLTTSRARIRPLRTADAAAYAAGTEDAEVRAYAHLPEPKYTQQSVTTMITETTDPGLERGDLAVLAIADPATDAFAGSVVVFDVTAQSAELGFWMHPAHRGKGMAAAALELAAEFVARSGPSRVTARTVAANTASRRVLAHAAFTEVERMADTAPSGQRIDLLHCTRRLDRTAHLPRRTEHLVLRLHEPDDATGLERIYSRPDVARYLLEGPWTRARAEEQLTERLQRTGLERGAGALAAIVEHDGQLIGDVALWLTDRGQRLAEVGWVLDPEHAGRGFATEAVREMLDLAIDHYGVHRVAAQMDARNLPSARLAERAGMVREAHLRQHWWSKGEWTDTLIFAMLASDR